LFSCDGEYWAVIAQCFHFGVPSFIIIWAMYMEKSWSKQPASAGHWSLFLKKKLFPLIRIYLFWSLLYFLITANWNTLTVQTMITKHSLGYGWSGQYFIIILFQLLLLFPVLRWIYARRSLYYIFTILSFLLYVLYGYGFESLPSILVKTGRLPFFLWVVYVFAGISMAKPNVLRPNLAMVLLLPLIPLEWIWVNSQELEYLSYVLPSVLIGSVVLCLVLVKRGINYKKSLLTDTIHYVGSRTMTIFVANPLVIIMLDSLFPDVRFGCESIFGEVLAYLLATTLVLGICLLIERLIAKVGLKGIIN
jgi:hypothetical protein